MTTVTPYRSPVQDGPDGFPQLLHAEWTKFRTVRGWVIGMIVAILVTAGIGLFLVAASGNVPCQPGRLRAPVTLPSATVPGEPTPTPARAAGSSSAAAAASRSAAAISAATSAGPPSVGVARRADPSTLKASSMIAAWIFVPPRSIPPCVGIERIMSDGPGDSWRLPAMAAEKADVRASTEFMPACSVSSNALTGGAQYRGQRDD